MDEMIKALQSAGVFVLEMSRFRSGFDLLAIGPSGSYILRYGDEPLTSFEALVKAGVEAAGGGYYIVRNPQEAIDLVRGDALATCGIIERGAKYELLNRQIDC